VGPTDAEVDPESTDATPSAATLLDHLIDAGIVVEAADGTLSTTDDYEATRVVYADSYGDVDEATFLATLASTFDLDRETARARVDRDDVTRADLVDYLALSAALSDPPADPTLARMAGLLTEVAPATPVPDGVPAVDDPAAFLVDHPDAVVTVWRRHCAPCEALKGRLDDLLAAIDAVDPAVPVVGVDGEASPPAAFLRRADVDRAPAAVVVRDGAVVDAFVGRIDPGDVAAALSA
jgi:hypothetical protein